MVCLGNICRSPLAEGILRSKLSNNFIVDSAGTGGWHAGELPDKRSIEIAKKNRLPDRIIDFIRTHHGTTMVYYFYRNTSWSW